MIDVVPVVSRGRTVAHHCSGWGSEGGLRGGGTPGWRESWRFIIEAGGEGGSGGE